MMLRVCKGYLGPKGERLHSKECVGAAYTQEDLEKFAKGKGRKYGKRNQCLNCNREYNQARYKAGHYTEKRRAKRAEWLKQNPQPLRLCPGYPWEGEYLHSKNCAIAAHTKADLEKFKKHKTCKYGRTNRCLNCLQEYEHKRRKAATENRKAKRAEWVKQNPQPLRVCRGYIDEQGKRRYSENCAKEAWTTNELENFIQNKSCFYGRSLQCKKCRNESALKGRAGRTQLRFKVLERICNGEPHCQDPRCNWDGNGPCKEVLYLCIDHIHGNGAEDRKRFRNAPSTFHGHLLALP